MLKVARWGSFLFFISLSLFWVLLSLIFLFVITPAIAEDQSISYIETNTRPLTYLPSGISPKPSHLYSSKNSRSLFNSASQPDSFDLRNVSGKAYVTEAKDQGDFGTCWVFSTIATLESSAIKSGLVSNPDFSEAFLDYSAFNPWTYEATADVNYWFGVMGGNSYVSSGILYKGFGIKNESDYPYSGMNDHGALSNSISDLTYNQVNFQNFELKDVTFYDDIVMEDESKNLITVASSISQIKEQILNFKPVTIGFFVTFEGYEVRSDSLNAPWYSKTFTTPNHAVTLVGYDDNFSKENFPGDTKPDADGAFLAKNSWGSEWGWDGYFWLSYYDKSMIDPTTFEISSKTSNTITQHYNESGWLGWVLGDNPVRTDTTNLSYANVYDVPSTSSSFRNYLTSVQFFSEDPDETDVIKIYTNLTDATNPRSGTLALTQTVKPNLSGYHTWNLSKSIQLDPKTKYSIEINVHVDEEGYYASGPIESKIYSEADNVEIKRGQSFFFWQEKNKYYDLVDYYASGDFWYFEDPNAVGNVILKAVLTTSKPSSISLTKVSSKSKSYEVYKDKTVNLSLSKTPSDAFPATLSYKFSDSSIAKMSNGKVKGLKQGSTTLTISSKSNSKVKTTVKITVIDPAKEVYADLSKVTKARKSSIVWLYTLKIVNACKAATKTKSADFCPNKAINRGEFAEFLRKLAGSPTTSAKSSVFTDVFYGKSRTITYAPSKKSVTITGLSATRIGAINWLYSTGITGGSGEDDEANIVFKPQAPLTRGAFAQMMYRFINPQNYQASKINFADTKTQPQTSPKTLFQTSSKSNTKSTFKVCYDGKKKCSQVKYISEERLIAINWLYNKGVTHGSGTTKLAKSNSLILVSTKSQEYLTFRPQDAVNRGSLAQFFHRTSYYVLKSTNIKP